MVGSAAIKQGRLANRKHTYFFFLALIISDKMFVIRVRIAACLSVKQTGRISTINPVLEFVINPKCIWETTKQVHLQKVKTQMKCSIKLHFIRVYTVC